MTTPLPGYGRGALGGVVPGVLLVLFGYSVDAATGAYAGELAKRRAAEHSMEAVE